MCPEIDVSFDGDDVVVHCQTCGRSCVVPPGLPVRALRQFYDLHPEDRAPESHHDGCPQWQT